MMQGAVWRKLVLLIAALWLGAEALGTPPASAAEEIQMQALVNEDGSGAGRVRFVVKIDGKRAAQRTVVLGESDNGRRSRAREP